MLPTWPEMLLAFTAGLITLFSPCSFPLLPGYILYYLGYRFSLTRAIMSGLICASGIILVFSLIGASLSVLGGIVAVYIPLLQVWAGAAIIFMGIILIVRSKFPAFSVGLRAPGRRGFIGILVYGVIYGLASAGCSAPIFFSMLLYALSSGGAMHCLTVFIAYAVGMGLPIAAISAFITGAKELLLKRIVMATQLLQTAGGFLLIAIGLYLICQYYFIGLF